MIFGVQIQKSIAALLIAWFIANESEIPFESNRPLQISTKFLSDDGSDTQTARIFS